MLFLYVRAGALVVGDQKLILPCTDPEGETQGLEPL